MRRLLWLPLIGLANIAHADDPPRQLVCLQSHYPMTLSQDLQGWIATLPGGAIARWDDGKPKTLAMALDDADLEDTLQRPYRAGAIRPVTDADEDPGRVRVDALFAATYPKRDVTLVDFLGHRLRVHRRALPAFARVAKRLEAARIADPGLHKWLAKFSGTFVVRNIAGTDRPSNHSYGISIDLDASRTDYWRWPKPSLPLRWRNSVPQAIVDAFEAEGFIWGGRWYHYDTMHFEYRPELFDPACR